MNGLFESSTGGKSGILGDAGATSSDKIKIMVVGVGGAGCNTINRLSQMGIKSAETVAINTDSLHLKIISSDKKVLIGKTITKGLGAGGFPEVAAKCAQTSKKELEDALDGVQLLFLCAGMGGGTGTGAAPIIAEIAKEQGAIVVAMVTFPFSLERIRMQKAVWGIEELKKTSDTVVIIDNNRLVSYVPNLPLNQAFAVADELTAHAVKGIADTIMFPSLVNIDFADMRAIMGNAGVAIISVGEGKGNDKVERVVKNTLDHPLLDVDYTGARGALIHIAGGKDLTIGETTQIGEQLTDVFHEDANVIWGARLSPEMGDSVRVTSIMTGITSPHVTGKEELAGENGRVVELSGIEQILL
ncbi:MAG: cell division protein FtsZ [Candidatus Micrarchaeota archaeon]